MLPESTVLTRSSTAIALAIGGTIAIRDEDPDELLVMDPVGSRIWDLLVVPITLGSLTRMLAGEFETDADLVSRDVEPFIQELARRKFVQMHTP